MAGQVDANGKPKMKQVSVETNWVLLVLLGDTSKKATSVPRRVLISHISNGPPTPGEHEAFLESFLYHSIYVNEGTLPYRTSQQIQDRYQLSNNLQKGNMT